MPLTIKSAAEYAAEQAARASAAAADRHNYIVSFINNTIQPKIESMIANPEKYTSTNSASFQVNSYPAEKFVAEVAALLVPLGYGVRQSHDGGGMYATIVISWGKK
jgi:hypothetical protein